MRSPGSRLVWVSESDPEIHGIANDGSQGANPIEPPDFLSMISQDRFASGRRAIYRTVDFDFLGNIFSVPIDGSQPMTQLSVGEYADFSPSGVGPNVLTFIDNPDGNLEGFAVPVAGNLPPVKVSGLSMPGDIVFPTITINSAETWVVYESEQQNDAGLYSRHLDLDADGAPDETDNCPGRSNPDQGAVVFDQDALATSKIAFSWDVTVDVSYVRGAHDHRAAADAGRAVLLRGAVNRRVLPDNDTIAESHSGRGLSREREVLARASRLMASIIPSPRRA